MQQRATGWNRTSGCCSEDTASVHGAPALPTELLGRPSLKTFLSLQTHHNYHSITVCVFAPLCHLSNFSPQATGGSSCVSQLPA